MGATLKIGRRAELLLVVSCAVALAAPGCRPYPELAVNSPPRPLAVIVSCDTAGWIVPCGCSSKQAGGLLRRATYVNQIRGGADVLLADAGGAPGGVAPYDRLKFAAVLRGEAAMDVSAHNVGAAEAELGAAVIRDLARSTGVSFISTNVRDAEGNPLVSLSRVVTCGSQRVAVLGVLSPRYARPGLQVDPPGDAVLKHVTTLKGAYDQLVVLAYLPEEELELFVGQVPEADLVIGGPTLQSIAPRRTGPTTWGAVTNKGKFLAHLQRDRPDLEWTGKIVELGAEIADHAAQEQNLRDFREELARVDFRADQTSFAPRLARDLPAGFEVAGVEACMTCHVDDCTEWRETRHAHAWQTLVEKSSHVDPYCQHCHTTGYGLPGGFTSLASAELLGNVGCEACHGPSRAHSLRPATQTAYNARDRCRSCHDVENSPEFEFDSFWDQIAHGLPTNPAKVE
ncbi:MAG: hypothetical protein EHM42_07355 [Planctomycetaceae bacterium]|nr:MAG: hypothetical protein EHM42_07355 [Planctomycetaceae bacterium]